MSSKISDFFRLAEPIRLPEPGVYVILRARDGLVKIGMSEDLPDRVATILASCGSTGEVLHLIHTDRPRECEAFFHRVFRAAHVKGEWFRLTAEDVERLKAWKTWPREDGCEPLAPPRPAARGETRREREARKL
jgi:hypothetical protein